MRRILVLAALVIACLPTSAEAAVPPISFAPAVLYPTGQFVDSPSVDENGTAAGDFNGDGRSDVVAVDQAWGNTVVIQYNLGAGRFSTPGTAVTISGGIAVENVVAGRFSSSGRTDIVVLTSASTCCATTAVATSPRAG